jgi:hypothetical protein
VKSSAQLKMAATKTKDRSPTHEPIAFRSSSPFEMDANAEVSKSFGEYARHDCYQAWI